jgi:hypothetical protein
MPETLFQLECGHGARVAGGTHQTSAESALTFKHLFHYCTNACIPL